MNDEQEYQPVEEYEREPVPEDARLGFKSFIGMYTGEHCAGTELMIGPLLAASGVAAFDLIMGLLVGNALAVLSWMLLTAPIATRSRLTLYYQLERICGPWLVKLYNLANGLLFCFLAGAMITVSATAAGVWFDFPMPGLDAYLPNSAGWVISVLIFGSLITIVAVLGYESVAKFANVATPWMAVIFLVFGLVALRNFMIETGVEITSAADLWEFARTELWPGGEPKEGQTKFTFWHVTCFAWFTNLAMHIGMSDLTVLRYAKKSWYSIASASGMYVGHFMAWISASLLFAFEVHQNPELSKVLPGPLAYNALGITGVLCVIVAGWTTANPTIYRAGLAFQSLKPEWPTALVTLIAGTVATIAGLFPAFAMQLLGFAMLYGLILMPMGAVIFADFWLFESLGLERNLAEQHDLSFNWAAGITWILTVVVCLLWERMSGRMEVFFVGLPGWFIAFFLYLALSKLYQNALPDTS